jgi:hypothetical protein
MIFDIWWKNTDETRSVVGLQAMEKELKLL